MWLLRFVIGRRVSWALPVEVRDVPKVFSQRTLRHFENASASIPLRQIDRVFERAAIGLGKNPDESGGTRRTHFRRFIAGVDQHDPHQLDRLGDALGALIDEVAASKQEFLVNAAEGDGFCFANGRFRLAETAPSSFAVLRGEDLVTIDDRGKRLHYLANDSPKDAIGGAKELVESVCRTVLQLIGEPPPEKALDLVDLAESMLEALDFVPADIGDATNRATLVRKCLQQLADVVASLSKADQLYTAEQSRDVNPERSAHRQARLAVGAAVTFAGFVADMYVERVA